MKRSISMFYFLIPIVVITFGCRKISTPTEESKALFGSWQFKNCSGGNSGGGNTLFNSENWIEFTDNGVYRMYKGSKKECQKRFKIELKESIHDANLRPAIIYRFGKYETYQIFNDTLYISDEMYDGYSYCYVRK